MHFDIRLLIESPDYLKISIDFISHRQLSYLLEEDFKKDARFHNI